VGARGRVALAGTLAKPVLGGAVRSTDGTLSFYRNFVLQRGVVAFDRTGIIPNVDATATTEVPDPPTEILLHVSGPATALNLDLASRPNYDRAQILGLLVNAQALGAVRGVQTFGTAASAPSIDRLAGGFLAQQFTRSLLEPFGGQMGRALGFDSVALGYDFTSGLGAGFTRRLGKRLSGTFQQEFGGGQRQSLALNARLREATSVQLTVFGSASGANRAIGMTSPLAPSAAEPVNYTLEALAPPTGSSGFVMTYQRKYK
jgi:hypothetical protein